MNPNWVHTHLEEFGEFFDSRKVDLVAAHIWAFKLEYAIPPQRAVFCIKTRSCLRSFLVSVPYKDLGQAV